MTAELVVRLRQGTIDVDYTAEEAACRIEKLAEGLRKIPFQEYGDAQGDGCDPNGAWDCFYSKADEHIKEALAADKCPGCHREYDACECPYPEQVDAAFANTGQSPSKAKP
jgi:hypothetical protein